MGRVLSSPQTQLHFKEHQEPRLYEGNSLSQNTLDVGNYYSPRFHESNHSRRSSGGPGTQVFEHKKQADNMKKMVKEFGVKEAVTEMSWQEAHEPACLIAHTHHALTQTSSTHLWSRQLEPQTERPTVSSILKTCGTPQSVVQSVDTDPGHLKKKGGILPLKKRLFEAKQELSVQSKMRELSSKGLTKFGSPHLMKRETALQRYKRKQDKQIEAWKTASASQMDYTHLLKKMEDKQADKDGKSPLAKALKKKGAYSHNNLPIGPKRATHHKKYGSRGETKIEPVRRQCSSIYPHSLHTSAHITPDKPAKVEKLKEKAVVDEAIPTIENFEEEPKIRKELVASPVPFGSKSRNIPVGPLNQSSIQVKQHALILEQAEADAIRESVKPDLSRRFSGSVKKILSPIQQQSEPPTPEQASPKAVQDLPRPFTFLEDRDKRNDIGQDDDMVVVVQEKRSVKLLSIEREEKEERKQEVRETEDEGNNNPNNYQNVQRDQDQERERLKQELKRLESQLKEMEEQKKIKEKHHSSGSNPIESMSLDLNNSSSRADMRSPEASHSTVNVMDGGLRMEMEKIQHCRTKSSNTLTQERREEPGNNEAPKELVQNMQGVGSASSSQLIQQPQQQVIQQQIPPYLQSQPPQQYSYPYIAAHPQIAPAIWGMPQPAYYAYPYPAPPPPPPPQYFGGYYPVAQPVLPGHLPLAPLVQQSTVQSGFSSRNPSIAALGPKGADPKRPQLSLNSISNINNNTQTGGLFSPLATGSLRNVFAIGSTVDSQVQQRDINSSNQLILEDFRKAEAVYQERQFQMLKNQQQIPSINSVDRGSKLTRKAAMLSSASPTSSLRHKPGHESKFGLYSSQSRKLLHTARDALFTGDSMGRSQSCARTAKHSRDSSLELMVKEVGDRRGSKQVTSGLLSPNEEDQFNMEGSLDKPGNTEEMCSPIDSLMQAHSERPRISSSSAQKQKTRKSITTSKLATDKRKKKMWVFSDDDEPRVFSEDGDNLGGQDNQSGQFRTTTGLIDISASSIKSRKKNTPEEKNKKGEENYDAYLREAEGSSEERIRKAVYRNEQSSRDQEDDTLIYDNIHEMGERPGFESPQIYLRKELPHTNSSQTLREQSSGSGVLFGGGMQVELRCQNQSTTFGEMENARIFLGKNKQMVVTDSRSRTSRPYTEELFTPERGQSPAIQDTRKESHRYNPQEELEPEEEKEQQVKGREVRATQAAPSRLTHLASQNTSSVLKKSVTIDLFLTPEEIKGQEREGRSRERLEPIGEKSQAGLFHQERTKSLAEVFQARKQSFIEKKKEKQEKVKKREKPAGKTKEELAKLRREMVKRKKPRQESKSVDVMNQMLSRDPSKANTALSDLAETGTPSLGFNGVDSEMSTLRSPGGFSVASGDKRARKEPSLDVQIRLAQGLKPKINMKQARKKAKIQCSVLPEQKSKVDEERKKLERKELSQKKKEYDKKLRECLKKKSKQVLELQQDLLSKCAP